MRVGAVNLRVTGRAVLDARRRHIVEARRVDDAGVLNVAVAFKTELRDVVAFEQARVAGPMRAVASRAAFDLAGRVLENKRPLLVGVALEAGSVGAGGEPGLLGLETAMRIVAIAALHGTLNDLVVEGLVELTLHLVVAGDAQLRVALDQHLFGLEVGRVRRKRADRSD